MTMSIEAFKQLPPEEQQTVLAARRRQVDEALENAARESGLTQSFEELLVPQIKGLRHEESLNLPPVPDDPTESIREFMRRDRRIVQVTVQNGVDMFTKYRP